MVYLTVGILVLTTVAGLAGWLLNDWSRHARSVRVMEIFAGTVVYDNGSHDAGCVQAGSGTPRICGRFFLPAGTAVTRGDKVLVAHELVHTHANGGYDLLLLYPGNPPP
jgi:hypothetical protein